MARRVERRRPERAERKESEKCLDDCLLSGRGHSEEEEEAGQHDTAQLSLPAKMSDSSS